MQVQQQLMSQLQMHLMVQAAPHAPSPHRMPSLWPAGPSALAPAPAMLAATKPVEVQRPAAVAPQLEGSVSVTSGTPPVARCLLFSAGSPTDVATSGAATSSSTWLQRQPGPSDAGSEIGETVSGVADKTSPPAISQMDLVHPQLQPIRTSPVPSAQRYVGRGPAVHPAVHSLASCGLPLSPAGYRSPARRPGMPPMSPARAAPGSPAMRSLPSLSGASARTPRSFSLQQQLTLVTGSLFGEEEEPPSAGSSADNAPPPSSICGESVSSPAC
jgi:hypothetical protein